MNKFKYFCSILLTAVFAFSLASCEKENFQTDIESDVNAPAINIPGVDLPPSYQPGDAVISIQPTVWAVINSEIQNVTALATLKFNDEPLKTYTKTSATGFTAMYVKVVAIYEATVGEETKTLSAETTIEVPTLKAGQVAIFTPTLVMSAKSDAGEGGVVVVPETNYAYVLNTTPRTTPCTEELDGYFDITNKSSYYYYYTQGVFQNAMTKKVEWETSAEHEAGVALLKNVWKDVYKEGETREDVIVGTPLFYVYSNSVTRIHVDVSKTTNFYSIEYDSESRAAGIAGTLTVSDYVYIYDSTEYFNIDGVSHGHGHGHGLGHGHDHGHGGSNAGGGIVNGI